MRTLSWILMLCNQFIWMFSPLLVGDQFHIHLTAQSQNAVPRAFALLTYQTYQTSNALFNLRFLLLLFPVDCDTHKIFFNFILTFLMPQVCFKPVDTWYIEMHHVRTFFLCGVMTFSYYVMFIHNMFIFKRKAYRGFCLPWNCQHDRCLSAEDNIWQSTAPSGTPVASFRGT